MDDYDIKYQRAGMITKRNERSVERPKLLLALQNTKSGGVEVVSSLGGGIQ